MQYKNMLTILESLKMVINFPLEIFKDMLTLHFQVDTFVFIETFYLKWEL